MPLCSRCRKRKAKRDCPALGSSLCSLCCGQVRNRDIHCPEHCPFLVRHAPYQTKRAVDRDASAPAPSPSDDILQDERLAWLVYHIEHPIKVFGENKPGLTDGEAVAALDYARQKLERAERLLVVPGEGLRPSNALGEAVLQSMDQCRYERTLVLPTQGHAYTRAEKIKCLDRVLLTARHLAKPNPQGRRYIDHVGQQISRVEDLARRTKIQPPS